MESLQIMSDNSSNSVQQETPSTPVRKSYNSYDQSTKQQICQAARNDEDWEKVAKRLKVNPSTARTWIRYDLKNQATPPQKQRGGRREGKIKLTEQIVSHIIDVIERNPQISLKNMQELVYTDFEVSVSQQAIKRKLDGKCITYKKAHYEPDKMNTEENKLKRKQYLERLADIMGQGRTPYFVDETNSNVCITRTCGRARMGERAKAIGPSYKGKNTHIIGCINASGFLYYVCRTGSYRMESAQEYMRGLLRKIAESASLSTVVIIIDNAPYHSQMERVFQEEEFLDAKLLRLGPYSPMLNPIENIWSGVKAQLKDFFNIHKARLLNPPANMLIIQHRDNMMVEAVEYGMSFVNAQMCSQAYMHTLQHHNAIRDLQDVQVGQ